MEKAAEITEILPELRQRGNHIMTELVGNGKYDEKGNLKPVDRTILPFQVVETINESKAYRVAPAGKSS